MSAAGAMRTVLFLLASLPTPAGAQSSFGAPPILEWNAVMHPAVSEVLVGKDCAVRLTGLDGNSALAVDRIEIQGPASHPTVRIHQGLVRADAASGEFEVIVPLTERIESVAFGDAAHVVWRRVGAPCRDAR